MRESVLLIIKASIEKSIDAFVVLIAYFAVTFLRFVRFFDKFSFFSFLFT